MIKKVTTLFLAMAMMSSCVSKKVFNELESKYANLKKENRNLEGDKGDLEKENAAIVL